MIELNEILDENEINEFYDTMFDIRQQFKHQAKYQASLNKSNKINLLQDVIEKDNKIFKALIVYKAGIVWNFHEALKNSGKYLIFDDKDERDSLYEELTEERALDWIDECLNDDAQWLRQYINEDSVIDDYRYDRSYAEVLSSYEEEYECTIDDTTYYIYRE